MYLLDHTGPHRQHTDLDKKKPMLQLIHFSSSGHVGGSLNIPPNIHCIYLFSIALSYKWVEVFTPTLMVCVWMAVSRHWTLCTKTPSWPRTADGNKTNCIGKPEMLTSLWAAVSRCNSFYFYLHDKSEIELTIAQSVSLVVYCVLFEIKKSHPLRWSLSCRFPGYIHRAIL